MVGLLRIHLEVGLMPTLSRFSRTKAGLMSSIPSRPISYNRGNTGSYITLDIISLRMNIPFWFIQRNKYIYNICIQAFSDPFFTLFFSVSAFSCAVNIGWSTPNISSFFVLTFMLAQAPTLKIYSWVLNVWINLC